MGDRFSEMTLFVAVAEQGSFSAAAKICRVSPQAVTRAIASMESRMNVRLLQRTTRSVRLTDRGASFLVRCRSLLAELHDAEGSVAGLDAEPNGTLSITAPVLFGRLHVMPIVTGLLKKHKKLAVRLMLADRFVHLVDEGIDVAVRIGALSDSSLVSLRVGQVQRVTVASQRYLKQRGEPLSIGELRHHDIVAFAGISASNEWRFGPKEKAGVQVKPRLVVDSADAAIQAVEAGMGITRVLSYQVSEALASGRLHTVLTNQAPPPIPISIIYHADRLNTAGRRAFVEGAVSYFRSNL